ncbi:OmpH family outer membrane protein [Halpernia frigidisoli]|uniref:Periplasmic chaperone for outer membrane proteins Skp n=1 Tax=Halpernia frigidisoli TaxID=1125876 RepID=A0A1I3I7E9_9FLAO|nr:OmpH family outer membrane protein [Halpernia frigidisoli]SFI43861.1 periplasmic chaperone for outer membrane proteins Skp [Halpernia frigidisoli]
MKKLSVLFAAVVMLLSVGVKAQKVASLDVATILNMMPEKKKADDQLEAYSKAKQAEIQKAGESTQAIFQKYQEEAPKQTAEVNKTREAELQKMQADLQAKSAAAQKDVADKTNTTFAPIEAKFNAAVEKVAKANGWDFIFDANNPSLIYKTGPDATSLVRKELGL